MINYNIITIFKKTCRIFIKPQLFKIPAIRNRIIIAALLILFDVLITSSLSYFSKIIIDSLSGQLYNTALIFVVLFGVFCGLEKSIIHIQDIIFYPVINYTIRELSYEVISHIHQIPLVDYQALSMPEVINSLRRISLSARAFIKIIFLMIIPTIIKLIISVIIIIKIAYFGLLLIPLILLVVILLCMGSLWYIKSREQAWALTDNVIMRISDSILNTKLVRPFYSSEMHDVGALLTKEAHSWYKANTRSHMLHVGLGLFLGLIIALMLSWGVIFIQKGLLTMGNFVLLKAQLLAAFLPFRIFASEFRQLAESLIDIKKIIALLEIEKAENNIINPCPQEPLAISLKNIAFAYPDKKYIFDNLNLDIKKGEKVALIGKTGSGKSALINMMAGFYKPHQGIIYCAPTTIYCIPQDFRLFNLSLYYNITYGINNIGEKNLLDILEKVGLKDLISAMPEGINTTIGEMGIKLSGGEKQKVALARALLLRPEILLLDETTSSLNINHEKIILEAVFSYIPTVIITSHRYSILEAMTRVIKVEEDTLIEIAVSGSKELVV
jgi:ATP-binding cassette subfamily B protein